MADYTYEVSITTPGSAQPALNPTATMSGANVLLNWTYQNVPGISRIVISRKTGTSGTYVQIADVSGSTIGNNELLDDGTLGPGPVVANTTYFYKFVVTAS